MESNTFNAHLITPPQMGLRKGLSRPFKRAIKAGKASGRPIDQRLASFLLTYRTTPHATTGEMPCQLFMGRKLRTRLDLLRPAVDRRVCGKQADQKVGHDRHAKLREVWVGQQVMARNWRPGPM